MSNRDAKHRVDLAADDGIGLAKRRGFKRRGRKHKNIDSGNMTTITERGQADG